MKTLLPLFFSLALVSAVMPTLAQTKPAAAGAAPSGGGSTSTTPQTGFVYKLRYKKHLQYNASQIDTFYFTYRQLVHYGRKKVFNLTVDDAKVISTTFYFDRKVVAKPSSDPINLTDYDMRTLNVLTDVQTTDIDPSKVKKLGEDDTVLIVKFEYLDSLPRYWAGRPSSLFIRHRLRLSITQDTALLLTKFLTNKFDHQPETDTVSVTNPNFKGKEPQYQQQRNFEDAAMEMPVLFYDTALLQPALRDYHVAKVNGDIHRARDIFDNRIKGTYKDHFAQRYAQDKESLRRLEKTKGYRDLATERQRTLTSNEYSLIRKRYLEVQEIYHDLSNEKKAKLNEQLTGINDADSRTQLKLVLDYIDSLLAFQSEFPRPQPKLAINIVDPLIPEIAIPINELDSAANFYFKIIHKNLVRQSIFYLPYHYASWDYGTLTAPFRYRFAPKGKYIFTQSGKDSTATSLSESDASLSVSLYFGRKWGRTRYYEDPTQSHNTLSFEPVVITGPTLIAMSLSNVDSNSKYAGANTGYTYTGPANILAWSLGVGGVVQWRTINVGLFAGKDYPLVRGTGWIYANKIWLGFGIGVNLGMLASGNSVN
jgi:hypothetical protein